MKHLFLAGLVVLLVSCDNTTPVTTTVSKHQDYTPPTFGTVTWTVIPKAASPCQGSVRTEPYGCIEGLGTREMNIWIHSDHKGFEVSEASIKHVLEHEFNHVVYGPDHL